MKTGIDYDTQFIGLKPDENSKSILELLDEEKNNGYANMTDEEITRIMRYRESVAANVREAELKKQQAEESLARTRAAINENIENMNKMISEVFNTSVKFEEVEINDGQES